MNPALHTFLEWLLRTSLQAAIITLLILLVQVCLRKNLDARWRHLLWLLVLARLAMPVSFPSPTSLFNYVRVEAPATSEVAVPPPIQRQQPPPPPSLVSAETDVSMNTEPVIAPSVNATPVASLPAGPVKARWILPRWPAILAMVWALGAALLVLRTAIQNILFCRRLRSGRAVDDPRILGIFRDCKALMGVRVTVRLIETDAVKSPALYGLFRPRLLMPPGMIGSFSSAELRHVLLHELAHVRRFDMLLQWLVMFFQIIHWFNPLLWFAFRRMSVDREFACDELALSVVGEGEGRAYGETIVKLLEACSQPPALPGLVGILEDKAQVFQRISMIARFRRHSRWSLGGLVAATVLAVATLTGAQTKSNSAGGGVDLTGTVQSTNGQPVSATVFIYTAGPKEGTSTLCPSCYADCRKNAKTDKEGHFKIESLDPQLLFRLLVVGKNCQPAFVTDVDPAKEPVRVTLKPQDLSHIPPDQTVRGRVVNNHGEPIQWATVDGLMVQFKDGTMGTGLRTAIDPLAVTDDHGQFVLTARRPVEALNLTVEAPGYAKRTFADVSAAKSQVLQLTEGAMVKGRVTENGIPLPDVTVGIVSEDRTPGNFTGEYEVGTDTNGVFLFRNLPPNVRYQVYGLIKTLQSHGATKTVFVNALGDGTIADAGDLVVETAHRISGRVVLADGRPIPARTKLLVDRSGAWDSVSVDLGPDGSFSVGGLPSGTVNLSVRIPGYRPSVKNQSLDTLNPYGLVGRVNEDISNLVILMEKGPRLESHFDATANGMGQPEYRPLAGAEHADDHSLDRSISGRVTDKGTGEPVASFRITPGRSTQFQGMNWNPQRTLDGTNGSYALYWPKADGPVALMVEAPGYLPSASPEISDAQTNYDFSLSQGSGPSGVVLLPNGKPAAGAQVGLGCTGSEMVSLQLSGGGRLTGFRQPQRLVTADASGRFSLPPQLGMKTVAACAPDGFKMVSVESLATNQQITLEPWSKVKGTLRQAGKPWTSEKIYLSTGGPASGAGIPVFIQAVTDDKGGFEFDFAPAIDCQIMATASTEDTPGRLITVKEIHIEPGQTVPVTIDAPAQPVVDVSRVRQRFQSFDEVPSKNLQGLVVLPDGKPAADVQVGIADGQHNLTIGDGELVAGPMNPNTARSDGNGAFTVPWPNSATALYAANEAGVAVVKIGGWTNGIRVELQPWARVEGTFRLNHRPAAGVSIHLHHLVYNFPFDGQEFQSDMTTDANGHFAIASVLPGPCGLGRWIDMGHGSKSAADVMQFDLAPGESTNIICGGDGRPVTGILDLTFSTNVPADAGFTISIHTAYPVPPQLSGYQPTNSMDQITKWRHTAQGEAALEAFHDYRARVAEDRTFSVDDVPPGQYEIDINGEDWNASPGQRSFIRGISAVTNIIVPPLADPDKCEPYDLGHLKVTATTVTWPGQQPGTNTLKAGDMAPGIDTTTYDGKPLRLADYRGKFVLLDFRYLLPGHEMDGLQSVNNDFGKDDRFVTISLSQSIDEDYVKQTLNPVLNHWIAGHLDFGKLADAYGLNDVAFPLILLVGPDGEIIASQLHGDAIYATVAKALKE